MTLQKNTNDILISTIIPSYNKHHFLKQGVDSVVQQSHTNQEIIIINDYPTFGARDELNEFKKRDPRIKILHNPKNIGIAASRNKAISYSTGKYIALLDHDDIWSDTDKLTKQITVLEKDKNISVLGTQYEVVDKDLKPMMKMSLPQTDRDIRNVLNFKMPFLQSSFMFPRKALERIGGYDPRVSMTDDYEILFRVGQIGLMQNLSDYTTLYRMHENTSKNTKNIEKMLYDTINVVCNEGRFYPRYIRAVLFRLCRTIPYTKIRPYLSDEFILSLRGIRDKIIT